MINTRMCLHVLMLIIMLETRYVIFDIMKAWLKCVILMCCCEYDV